MESVRRAPELSLLDQSMDLGHGVIDDRPRFERAIGLIDGANADDPNTIAIDGRPRPKELVHAVLATAWVRYFDPNADEAQLLAARAHHLRRWTLPRRDFDEGRGGYLRWRAALKKRHAAEVAELLIEAGYGSPLITRVQQIVRKEGLGGDPQVQTHEDALCLVFLQTQLAGLADQLGDDHIVTVIAKTIKKMSPGAIEAAVALDLDSRGRSLLAKAALGSAG